jgi:hypothetical protein
MRRIGFRRPSPPMVVAFVALSGTPNGWAAAAEDGSGNDAHVRVSVVCASP